MTMSLIEVLFSRFLPRGNDVFWTKFRGLGCPDDIFSGDIYIYSYQIDDKRRNTIAKVFAC